MKTLVVSENLEKRFLVNTENTGRFIVISKRTGRKYYVETIGDPHIQWGSVDVSTGTMNTKKGWKRYRGSIDEEESLINDKEFDKVHSLNAGESPLKYIDELDAKYENCEDKGD